MARRRRPVPLFEVINRDNRVPNSQRPPARSPATLAQTARSAADPTSSHPSASIFAHKPVDQASLERDLRIGKSAPPAAWPNLSAAFSQAWQSAKSRCNSAFQSVRTGAVASPRLAMSLAAIAAVALGLAIGHQITKARRSNSTANDIDLTQPHPGVLVDLTNNAAQDSQAVVDVDPPPQNVVELPVQKATDTEPPRRVVNLNYVIAQSYPTRKMADEAASLLNKNGIPCTVEQGVHGWKNDLFLVVGLKPFSKISGPDYAAYVKRIETLSPKGFFGFKPQPVKWDKTN